MENIGDRSGRRPDRISNSQLLKVIFRARDNSRHFEAGDDGVFHLNARPAYPR